jgi:hypothetical protein
VKTSTGCSANGWIEILHIGASIETLIQSMLKEIVDNKGVNPERRKSQRLQR